MPLPPPPYYEPTPLPAPSATNVFPENGFPEADQDQFGGTNEFVVYTPRQKESYLRRIGGGSLTLSLLVHAVLILIAFFLVKFAVDQKRRRSWTFCRAVVAVGKSNQAKLASHRKSVSMSLPKTRIVSTSTTSTVTLPDVPMDNSATGLSSFAMPSAGGMGGGEGGLKGSGKGGLMGSGFGTGVGPGRGAGFVSMFGKKLDSRRLAVVLDVSKSMHPFIPTVVKEANKISGGCPIVMFYGCGLTEPKDNSIKRKRSEKAAGRDFEQFWRVTFGAAADKDKKSPVPTKEVFDVFNDRRDTFYFEKIGNYAWLALTSNELNDADAIYWFADFKDPVDREQLEDMAKTMLKRRQKLYVHASGDDPKSLSMVEEIVVKPTGGQVLKIDIKPVKK